MDRVTIEYGQLPLDTDLLQAQQNAMIALGEIIAAFVGVGTFVDGFQLTPTSPASLSAVLSAGQVFEQEAIEATAWSSLPVNSTLIMKQGISLNPTTLTFAPPTTAGFEQFALVEVQYQDVDSGNVVRPYYNATDPSVPFNGPGNSGTADSTSRKGAVAIQIKYGSAAAAGAAVPPTPDAGWSGLYMVTLTTGQTTITAGSIAQYAGAPFINPKLGGIAGAVQTGEWTYAGTSTNAGNNFNVTLNPAPTSFPVGMQISATMNTPPTGSSNLVVNGTSFLIVRRGGAALIGNEWDGNDIVVFEIRGNTAQLTSLTVNDITVPTTETLASGEGVSVGGGEISLDVEGLASSTPVGGDLAVFFQESSGHHRNITISALLSVLLSSASIPNIRVLTTSGNYVPTAGYTRAIALAVGPGGPGGGSNGGVNLVGSGGESGTTAICALLLAGVTSIPFVIGAPSAPSAASAATMTQASTGTSTTFGTLLVAPAGKSGYNSVGAGPGPGGTTGATGQLVIASNPGEGAVGNIWGSGSGQGLRGGNGGASLFGGAGIGQDANVSGSTASTPTPGGNATGYGSGGGGADSGSVTAVQGGQGGGGALVIVELA